MKLKIKKLELRAGRPIAFLNEKRAAKLNVHTGDRIEISRENKKIVAMVDTVKQLIGKDEISLSKEIVSYLKTKPGNHVEVALALSPESVDYIIKKLNGHILTKE